MAEHQPGSTRMYHQYLHHVFYLVPVGFVLSLSTWLGLGLGLEP